MSLPFPEPTTPVGDRREVLLGYLDYFRAVVVDKVGDLDEVAARASVVPSGWSPIELANHLAHVEMRWLDWGFEGRETPAPWADEVGGRWAVTPGRSVSDVVTQLVARGGQTREVVLRHGLEEVGAPGDRWAGASPATLERVLLHLLQEYARHVGHLDVVRELLDGLTGE